MVDSLDLHDVTLVGQDWGALIGLRIAAEQGQRIARVVVANGFLPTGEQPADVAFRAWRAFARYSPGCRSGAWSPSAPSTRFPPRCGPATTRPSRTRGFKPVLARSLSWCHLTGRSGRAGKPCRVGRPRPVGEAVPGVFGTRDPIFSSRTDS